MLVLGSKLEPETRAEVLRAFVYRWTLENPYRESVWSRASSRPTIPLISDNQWLAEHAFHVTQEGRLHAGRRHAEPAFMAEVR